MLISVFRDTISASKEKVDNQTAYKAMVAMELVDSEHIIQWVKQLAANHQGLSYEQLYRAKNVAAKYVSQDDGQLMKKLLDIIGKLE